MPVKCGEPFQPALKKFCKEEPLTLDEVLEAKALLESKGTLDYTRAKCKDSKGKATGPFSASAANAKGDHTGSSMFGSWLRDNCIIAYGIWLTDPDGQGGDDAVACLNSIATFLLTYQSHKMELVINGHRNVQGDEKTWMDRPHIRFIGETGQEDTKWYNHKQNDALGYFLWARCQLALAGKMPFTGDHLKLCGQLFDFLRVIHCWDDLDAGHWEEHSAQHASSLGPVLAATRSFQQVLRSNPGWLFPGKSDTLTLLESKLEGSLKGILPNEVVKPGQNAKDADGALIFLCYPLDVVDQAMGAKILERLEKITGHIAVCRYRKDSYWCKDYKELYADPTKHFTDEELKERDANIKPGEEAQWCLFDPMISAYYGKLYQSTKKEEFLKKQQLYLARALAAITGDECEFGAWMCAEAFYLAKGKWQPNDNTPLVWTMVDLKMALYEMERSLGGSGKPSSSSCTVS